MLLPVATVVTAGPAGAAPAAFTLDMEAGGGTLQLRDAAPFALDQPTTIAGTVDTDTGVITVSSFTTPTVSFEQEVTSPLQATAFIDATFRTEGTGTGSIDADGNAVLTLTVAVDLQIEVVPAGSTTPLALPGDCTATPVELDLRSTVPYQDTDGPDGPTPGRVTMAAADFTVPGVPSTAECSDLLAGPINDQLAGSGHHLSLALAGDVALPPPAGCQTTTTVAVTPAGSSPVGEPIQVTATVTPVAEDEDCMAAAAAGEVPSGAVDVLARGRVVGSATLGADGTAIVTTSSLPAGQTVLSARYRGVAPFARSASDGVDHVVTAPPAITTTLPPFIEIGAGPVEFDVDVDASGFTTPATGVRLDMTMSRTGVGFRPSMLSVEVLTGGTWETVALTGPSSNTVVGRLTTFDLAPAGLVSTRVRVTFGPPNPEVPAPGRLHAAFELVPGDAPVAPAPADGALSRSGTVVTTLVTVDRAPATLTIGNVFAPAVTHTVRQGQTVVIAAGNVRTATGGLPALPPTGFIDVLLDGEPVPLAREGALVDLDQRVALTGGGNTPSVAFQLPTATRTGTRQVTVRYSGDAVFEPAQISLAITVVPAVGVLYECRADGAPSVRFRANVVAQANLPAAAPAGSEVDLDHLAVRLLTDRSISSTNAFFGLLGNEVVTPVDPDSNLRGVTFTIGPDGEGSATGVRRSFGTRLPATPDPATDVDQVIDPQGESGTVSIDGPVGSMVPVTLDAIELDMTHDVLDIPKRLQCHPVGDPVSFGVVRVSGVDVAVAPVGTSRAGEEVTVTADVGFADAAGVVELRDGAATVGLVPVSGRTTTFTTDALPVGDHSLTVRYFPMPAAPMQVSAVVAHTVLSKHDCEAFAEEGSGAVVRLVYLELLGRCPDQAGYTYWTGRLDGGTSPVVFARTISATPEAVGRVVDDAYVTMLGRPADTAGRAFWVERMVSGSGRYDLLLASLAGEQEFWNLAGGTSEGFVTRVYDRLLGRAPDAGGLGYWVGRLDAGASRGVLVRSLANLDEPLGVLVTHSYEQVLARTPSSGERTSGIAFLRSTGDRSGFYAQLIGRPEFAQRAQGFPNLGV